MTDRGERVRRAELRAAPWLQRPRRSVPQILRASGWQLWLFPFIFLPMGVVKILSQLWGEPAATGWDWTILGVGLIPWALLGIWLRRPTAR